MRCAKAERWISDEADGVLAAKEGKALARHLVSCPSCRAYRANTARLQASARALGRAAERPEADWSAFDARLAARLREERPLSVRAPRSARRTWVWGGAGLVAAAAAAVFFVLARPGGTPPGPFVFSFEDTVSSLLIEIGDDPALESMFDRALQASLDDAVAGAGEGDLGPALEDALLWEGLNDQELARIESGLRAEKRS